MSYPLSRMSDDVFQLAALRGDAIAPRCGGRIRLAQDGDDRRAQRAGLRARPDLNAALRPVPRQGVGLLNEFMMSDERCFGTRTLCSVIPRIGIARVSPHICSVIPRIARVPPHCRRGMCGVRARCSLGGVGNRPTDRLRMSTHAPSECTMSRTRRTRRTREPRGL